MHTTQQEMKSQMDSNASAIMKHSIALSLLNQSVVLLPSGKAAAETTAAAGGRAQGIDHSTQGFPLGLSTSCSTEVHVTCVDLGDEKKKRKKKNKGEETNGVDGGSERHTEEKASEDRLKKRIRGNTAASISAERTTSKVTSKHTTLPHTREEEEEEEEERRRKQNQEKKKKKEKKKKDKPVEESEDVTMHMVEMEKDKKDKKKHVSPPTSEKGSDKKEVMPSSLAKGNTREGFPHGAFTSRSTEVHGAHVDLGGQMYSKKGKKKHEREETNGGNGGSERHTEEKASEDRPKKRIRGNTPASISAERRTSKVMSKHTTLPHTREEEKEEEERGKQNQEKKKKEKKKNNKPVEESEGVTMHMVEMEKDKKKHISPPTSEKGSDEKEVMPSSLAKDTTREVTSKHTTLPHTREKEKEEEEEERGKQNQEKKKKKEKKKKNKSVGESEEVTTHIAEMRKDKKDKKYKKKHVSPPTNEKGNEVKEVMLSSLAKDNTPEGFPPGASTSRSTEVHGADADLGDERYSRQEKKKGKKKHEGEETNGVDGGCEKASEEGRLKKRITDDSNTRVSTSAERSTSKVMSKHTTLPHTLEEEEEEEEGEERGKQNHEKKKKKKKKMNKPEEVTTHMVDMKKDKKDKKKPVSPPTSEKGNDEKEVMLSSLAKDNTPEGHSSDEFSKLCSQYIDFPSRGLSNSYSTCFLNVILQCLVHTRPLLAYLLKDTWEECKMEGLCWCFLCGLRRHIHSFTSHVATCPLPFFPQDIISHLQMIAPQFELGIQQDASEFMNLAIDKLQSHFLPNNNGEKGGDVENPGADIIKLMFGGVECSVITCDAQHVSSTPNAMEILELQIKDPAKSLEDCLHMYTEQETLEEPYDCPKCKAKVRAQKQILFEEIPNILVITLKRFQGLQKMEKHIASPMVLDMAPFMFSTNENENENNIYDLYAAVIHEGPTISGGHYTCYVKNYQERWLLFNDAEVSYVQGKVQIGKAYMLLYIRRTVSPQPPSLVEESKEEEQDDAQSTGCESSQSIDDIEETEQIRSHFLKKRCINENLSADQMKRLSQYWIAEDTDKEVVVQRIRKALEYYKENGHFLLPSRGKNSTIYDEELKQLYMVNKGLYKTRSLVKERRMIHVMMLVASNLSKDYFLDQRAVYYLNKEVYHLKSELLDDIVVTLCRMLQCTRASLHLSVSASGSIKGPIIIYISGGIVIDVSKLVQAGLIFLMKLFKSRILYSVGKLGLF